MPKVYLKDILFNKQKVELLASQIEAVYTQFDKASFELQTLSAFPSLELKARIEHMATMLRAHLPSNYPQALDIILRALPPALDESLEDDDFGDFIYAPYALFVARYGCTSEHLQISLNAIEAITMRFSCEDAIRYFINKFPDHTLETLERWTRHKNYHVRRLCSEGTRPRLPWCQNIIISEEQALPLLENLKSDKTRYVTRSIANHLNDISKKSPELVMHKLKSWEKQNAQPEVEMQFIKKHALRTLVKSGNQHALAMLGAHTGADVKLTRFMISKSVALGEQLHFELHLVCDHDATAVVDYKIYFCNKGGGAGGQKVFKLQVAQLTANKSLLLSKNHRLRANMTTRKIYPGRHKIEILVNGKVLKTAFFAVQK